jgi:calcium permeable stress-gated cation channel
VMIGIFAVSECAGPTILMVLFLIGSILFHISFRNAVAPLLDTLPRDLEVVEEDMLAAEGAAVAETKNGHDKGAVALDQPDKKPGLFAKYMFPNKYSDYATLRRMVPRDFAQIEYPAEVESHAYYNPAIASSPPTLWVVRDDMGISAQEVAHTGKVIPISDKGASFNDKGKITWNHEDLRSMPVYEDKVYY